MPKSYNQKMKILYLMRILLEKTDEEHGLPMSDLIKELERYGINAERKSIYDDIEVLRVFGLDIENRRGKTGGYYIASRHFELPELKLLVDAVQSSKFITAKKSKELISKLERLVSHNEARQLHRQVVVADRIKTMNESIYYNVDQIHIAISNHVKISFQYFEWTVTKEMKLKKDGKNYYVSPWSLMWNEENYYLIGFDEVAGMVKHFRVDKMISVEILDERRIGREQFQKFDAASFAKRTFGMFGGTEREIDIQFENKFVGVVLDRFGKDVTLRSVNKNHFYIRVNIAVSNQFFGWLSALGTGAKILEPDDVRQEYKNFLEGLLKQYITHIPK